jgi:hypothetical protein
MRYPDLVKFAHGQELTIFKLGESHPRVAAGIKKNAMIVRENFGNLARQNFGDLGNLVAAVGNSLI